MKANIEQEWKVKSTSSDEIYTVQLLKDGTWKCSCPALKECKHIKSKRYYQERNQIKFEGYQPTLKFLRSDKSVRVEIDVSLDQWDRIAPIPTLPEGVYEITLKPKE